MAKSWIWCKKCYEVLTIKVDILNYFEIKPGSRISHDPFHITDVHHIVSFPTYKAHELLDKNSQNQSDYLPCISQQPTHVGHKDTWSWSITFTKFPTEKSFREHIKTKLIIGHIDLQISNQPNPRYHQNSLHDMQDSTNILLRCRLWITNFGRKFYHVETIILFNTS